MAGQKKGLIYRITMGKDNLPDFTPDKLPGTRFQVFKDVFFNRLGAMVKLNLFAILFALPAILVYLYFAVLVKTSENAILPYSSNLGIGYPVVANAAAMGEARTFGRNISMFLFMIPAIMILFIGLSGAFYVMKRFVWGEGVGVAADFFRGIKMNIVPFLWTSLFVALSFSSVMISVNVYSYMKINAFLKIAGLAFSILTFIIAMCMTIFLTTQAVTYKLKTFALIKNSFLLAIGLFPLNIIMLIISLLPIVLVLLVMNIQYIGIIVVMIFALVIFSYIILVWTVYAHWVFDKYINDKVEGAVKNRGMYVMTEEERRIKKEQSLKTKNVRFNNPLHLNKKISSIDEGTTFTPLEPTFSRADLERLASEKEVVKNEIDAEFGDVVPETKSAPKPEKTEKKKQEPPQNAETQSTTAKAKFTIKKK